MCGVLTDGGVSKDQKTEAMRMPELRTAERTLRTTASRPGACSEAGELAYLVGGTATAHAQLRGRNQAPHSPRRQLLQKIHRGANLYRRPNASLDIQSSDTQGRSALETILPGRVARSPIADHHKRESCTRNTTASCCAVSALAKTKDSHNACCGTRTPSQRLQ